MHVQLHACRRTDIASGKQSEILLSLTIAVTSVSKIPVHILLQFYAICLVTPSVLHKVDHFPFKR